MGEFPSGQRGQTVNLLRFASMVRIRPPPPEKVQHQMVLDFFCCWSRIRRTNSQHACGMLLPPVQKLVATLCCASGTTATNPSSPVRSSTILQIAVFSWWRRKRIRTHVNATVRGTVAGCGLDRIHTLRCSQWEHRQSNPSSPPPRP